MVQTSVGTDFLVVRIHSLLYFLVITSIAQYIIFDGGIPVVNFSLPSGATELKCDDTSTETLPIGFALLDMRRVDHDLAGDVYGCCPAIYLGSHSTPRLY